MQQLFRYFNSSPEVIRLEVGAQAVALIPSEHRTERHCHGKSNGMAENRGSSISTSCGNGSAPCLQCLISVVAESSVGYKMTLDGEDVVEKALS